MNTLKINSLQPQYIKKFETLFNEKPAELIFAPGRINIIGEHTDYSDGFVLPVAINLGVSIAMSPMENDSVELFSINFNDHARVNLNKLEKEGSDWKEFLKGVIWSLGDQGFQLKGWQGVISGNIPIGAGLSSSAATEIALIKAFMNAGGFELPPHLMAQIGRKAEQSWVGVNVGIMDQLISAAGKEGHAVLLDCRTLKYDYVPIPESIKWVVLDTNTRRELSHSEYNTRQKEVVNAAKLLGIQSLRDASLTSLHKNKNVLSTTLFKRARHVITENQRVKTFCSAMEQNEVQKMGALINESHISLRDDYEVSSDELNTIVEIAQKQPGCFGARMAGAGFGGCALALIADDSVHGFEYEVYSAYKATTGIEPHIFTVSSSDGVHSVNNSQDR